MTGYSSQEALGRKPSMFKSGKQDPAYYKELWETISAALVGGNRRYVALHPQQRHHRRLSQ